MAATQDPNTPYILRFGPPQMLSTMLPATPPMPVADWTIPNVAVLFPVRAKSMGVKTVFAKVKIRLITRKIRSRPSKLGRSKM